MTLRGLPRPDAKEIFQTRDLVWSPCKNLSLFDVHPLTDFPFQWNEGAKGFREGARERAPSFSLATPLHGDPLDETNSLVRARALQCGIIPSESRQLQFGKSPKAPPTAVRCVVCNKEMSDKYVEKHIRRIHGLNDAKSTRIHARCSITS